MGSTYKVGSPTHRSLRENMSSMGNNPLFSQNGNHYGVSGKGGAAVTTIKSDNPIKTAQEFFDKIGCGGVFMTDAKTGQITQNRVRLRDGTVINFRLVSKSGGPAVEINVRKGSNKLAVCARTKSILYKGDTGLCKAKSTKD